MAKQMGQLVKNLDSFSDGQLKVLEVDLDESQWITLEVTPNSGPYKGGAYQFKIEPPNVDTLTPLLHPNINYTNQCVCIAVDDVNDSYGLELLVVGLLYILQQPNYDDAYGHWRFGKDDKEAYRDIRLSLSGRKVGDFEGPRYIKDDDEILQFLEEKLEEEKRSKEEEECENEASRGDETEDSSEDEEVSEASDVYVGRSDISPDENVTNNEVSQENATNLNHCSPGEDTQYSQGPIPDSDIHPETAEPGNSALVDSTSLIETIQFDPGPSTSTGVRTHLGSSATHADVLPTFASLTLKESQQNSPNL